MTSTIFNRFPLTLRIKHWIVLGAILSLVYSQTLCYPFLWDDADLILRNSQLADISNLSTAIQQGFLQSLTTDSHVIPYYRPLPLAFLFGERFLFGEAVTPYRVVHCSLHFLSAILLYLLLARIFDSPENGGQDSMRNAFAGTLFFISTPYSVDAVVFLSNVSDLLVCNFILAMLLLYEKFKIRRNILAFIGALLCMSAALFSKETGIIAPLVPAVFNLLDPSRFRDKHFYAWLAAGIPILIVYFVTRISAIHTATGIDFVQTLKDVPILFFMSLRWAVYPHPLALMEPVPEFGYRAYLWLPLAAICSLWIIYIRRVRPLMVGGIFFTATILPSIAASTLVHFFSPRYLYIPSAGLAICFTWGYREISSRLKNAVLLVPALLLILAFVRADEWRSNLSLWHNEVERHPQNALAVINLGLELQVMGETQKSLFLLQTAVDISRNDKMPALEALALEKMGIIETTTFNNTEEAKKKFLASINVYPRRSAWISLGRLYAEKERNYKGALHAFLAADRLKRNQFDTYINIAGALGGLQRFDEAIHYLDKAESVTTNASVQRNILVQRRRDILSYQHYLLEEETKNNRQIDQQSDCCIQ